jgi:hypothetical protein
MSDSRWRSLAFGDITTQLTDLNPHPKSPIVNYLLGALS